MSASVRVLIIEKWNAFWNSVEREERERDRKREYVL